MGFLAEAPFKVTHVLVNVYLLILVWAAVVIVTLMSPLLPLQRLPVHVNTAASILLTVLVCVVDSSRVGTAKPFGLEALVLS